MPRKVQKSKYPESKERAAFRGYVNYELSEDQKAEVIAAYPEGIDLEDYVTKLVEQGYLFSVRWDDRSGCFLVMLMGYFVEGPNAGKILTARHTDLNRAVQALLYTVYIVFGGEEWPLGVTGDGRYSW